MASFALRVRVPTLTGKRLQCQSCVLRPVLGSTRLARPLNATNEVAEVANSFLSADLKNSLATLPFREASEFLLEHPVASLSLSVIALFIIPKLLEAFVRYLAAPVAIALLAFYALEFPEESAVVVTSVLDWINSNPELTSVIIIGLALFGLAPALLGALGATALVYALLSVSFGTQLPEVREMQGSFGETVSRVQFLSKVATKSVEQMLK